MESRKGLSLILTCTKGNLLESNWDQTPVSGLLKYNFTTRVATNSTVVGTSTAGKVQRGQMHHVPNFGPNGVLVAGGGRNGESGPLLSFSSVQIYDLATDTWYEQTTTGNYPDGRVGFCMTGAASSNKTYEIVVYAGYGGDLGSRAMSRDELFVLSLPSFHWFKANYRASQPRHALTCEHLGGGQVLTIGGVDSSLYVQGSAYDGVFNTRDPNAQGLALFDLSRMSFTSGGYVSNRTVYNLAPELQSYYDNKLVPPKLPRASNSSDMADHLFYLYSNRMAEFSYAGLADTFAVEDFTDVATTDNNGSDATTTETGDPNNGSGSSSGSNTGAIAGGVVGGVAGIALIGAAGFFILRRRSKRAASQQNNDGEGAEKTDFCQDGRGYPRAEMPGAMSRTPEAEGSTPHAELPDTTRRYELS